MVSRPTYLGGLGFSMKWNMGWMNDTLAYMRNDPVHRRFHHNQLTFGQLYAYTENFLLPLSHDEVVHGKGSLLGKMPGDAWQKFANVRLLLAYQFASPGKKLNFMGNELAQGREWRVELGTRLGTARHRLAPRRADHDARPRPALPRPARAARPGFRAVEVSAGSIATTPTSPILAFERRARDGIVGRGRAQFHAGAAARLPHRLAEGRRLARGVQQRLGVLRRLQCRQCRRHRNASRCRGWDRGQSAAITLPPLARAASFVRRKP